MRKKRMHGGNAPSSSTNRNTSGTPMKVYYNAFWENNEDMYKHPFFHDILEKSFNIKIELGTTPEESDILIESVFGDPLVKSKDWKYSFFFTGEASSTPNPEYYSLVLGYTDSIPTRHIKCPLFLTYTYKQPNHKGHFSFPPPQDISIPPIKGVLCVISNGDASLRNKYIQMLEDAGIPMYYGGKYKNNIGGPIQATVCTPEFYEVVSKYRCIVTMENTDKEYYITEKIFHGFYSNTVPIYWGSKHISEIFNEKRFVNVTDPESPNWIQTVKRLLDDDIFYKQTLLESVYKGGSPSITIDTVAEDIKKILQL
jgi:hypothetical protein